MKEADRAEKAAVKEARRIEKEAIRAERNSRKRKGQQGMDLRRKMSTNEIKISIIKFNLVTYHIHSRSRHR